MSMNNSCRDGDETLDPVAVAAATGASWDMTMRRTFQHLAVLACLTPLAGCLTGGANLASLSPNSAGIAALGEGLIGQAPGVSLSGEAKEAALEAEYQALQFGSAGQAVAWKAGDVRGEVVPTQLYRVGSQDCRGYSHAVFSGDRSVKEIGTACRTPKGFWKPIA